MINGIGYLMKEVAANQLIAKANASVVSTRQEHEAVGALVNEIRATEKQLEAEYESLEIVQEARRIQKEKGALAKSLEDARKAAKAKMLNYEDFLEAERVAEELKAQITSKTLAEESALLAALEAEQSGDKATAEAIIQEPVTPAVIVVPKDTLKAQGHTRRRVFKYKVTDASKIPADYLTPDLDKIAATVRAWKKEGEVIPGVLAYSEVV